MINVIQNLEIISNVFQKRILALFSQIDNTWDYYYLEDFSPKTKLDTTHKLSGYRITEYVANFQNTSLNSDSFKLKLGKDVYKSEIEWSHDEFMIIKGTLDD